MRKDKYKKLRNKEAEKRWVNERERETKYKMKVYRSI